MVFQAMTVQNRFYYFVSLKHKKTQTIFFSLTFRNVLLGNIHILLILF